MQVRYQAALRPDELTIIAAATVDLRGKAMLNGNYFCIAKPAPTVLLFRLPPELSDALLMDIKPGK